MIEMNNKIVNNKAVTKTLVNKVNKELELAVNNLKESKNTKVVNAPVAEIKNNDKIVNKAMNVVNDVKKSIKKMFTTQGDIVNINQNNKGKFRLQNGSKVYVTESIKNRNTPAPPLNNRKVTKSKHMTAQGNLKNVYENDKGRMYVVTKSSYGKNLHNRKGRVAQGNNNSKEAIHYPFGTSKFINGGDLLI